MGKKVSTWYGMGIEFYVTSSVGALGRPGTAVCRTVFAFISIHY
jgi:hypothetical protein